jgi:hypothetical protein
MYGLIMFRPRVEKLLNIEQKILLKIHLNQNKKIRMEFGWVHSCYCWKALNEQDLMKVI